MDFYIKDAASTRDKILQATLKIIREEGFQNITIKKIADLAEVNIAAVNYHFGSKNNVINEAMKVLNDRLMKCFDILEHKEIPAVERLRGFIASYTQSTLEYPDVFKNFITSAISGSEVKHDYVGFLKKEGVERLKDVLLDAGVAAEDEVLTMKMLQMISSLEFPILLQKQVKYLSGIDYSRPEIQDKYIDLILKTLLV